MGTGLFRWNLSLSCQGQTHVRGAVDSSVKLTCSGPLRRSRNTFVQSIVPGIFLLLFDMMSFKVCRRRKPCCTTCSQCHQVECDSRFMSQVIALVCYMESGRLEFVISASAGLHSGLFLTWWKRNVEVWVKGEGGEEVLHCMVSVFMHSRATCPCNALNFVNAVKLSTYRAPAQNAIVHQASLWLWHDPVLLLHTLGTAWTYRHYWHYILVTDKERCWFF